MKKLLVVLLAAITVLSFAGCGQSKGTAPEFMGGYLFGGLISENEGVEEPTSLYNKPLADVELGYRESDGTLYRIMYTFAPGVTLDIVLESIIEEVGTYSDYKCTLAKGYLVYGVDYSRYTYKWSFNEYDIQLTFIEDYVDLYGSKPDELLLVISDYD